MNAQSLPPDDIEELRVLISTLQAKAAHVASRLDPGDEVALAERIYRTRRRRAAAFGAAAELLAEPAWDMLLDLFVARHRGKKVDVSSACIASAVPSTTALRYIERMISLELIRTSNDERDRRRRLVELTDHGNDLMLRALGAWREPFLR